MTIEQTDTVDIVAIKPGSDTVELVISDHLSWQELHSHCRLLQEKINTYLAFVESGQLFELEESAAHAVASVRIVLATMEPPPESAAPFLRQVEQALTDAGYGFRVVVRAQPVD
jgi:hypothetical protein